MDDLDLDAIRARAIAAGGADAQWKVVRGGVGIGVDEIDGSPVVSLLNYDENSPTIEQAVHIAGMDPATTLALLDKIKRLIDEIDDLRDEVNFPRDLDY